MQIKAYNLTVLQSTQNGPQWRWAHKRIAQTNREKTIKIYRSIELHVECIHFRWINVNDNMCRRLYTMWLDGKWEAHRAILLTHSSLLIRRISTSWAVVYVFIFRNKMRLSPSIVGEWKSMKSEANKCVCGKTLVLIQRWFSWIWAEVSAQHEKMFNLQPHQIAS